MEFLTHPLMVVAETVVGGLILAGLLYIGRQLRSIDRNQRDIADVEEKLVEHEKRDSELLGQMDVRMGRLEDAVRENTIATAKEQAEVKALRRSVDRIWDKLNGG